MEESKIIKKAKLIYSGELLIFAIVFIVFGILFITGVLGNRETFRNIYPWITIFASAWLLIDFFWTLFSPRRRKKNSLLDKSLTIPSALAIIGFDIYMFIIGPTQVEGQIFRLFISCLFFYLSAVWIFQAVYHYYHPIPGFIESVKEAEEEDKKKEEASKTNIEENNQESPNEEEKKDNSVQ